MEVSIFAEYTAQQRIRLEHCMYRQEVCLHLLDRLVMVFIQISVDSTAPILAAWSTTLTVATATSRPPPLLCISPAVDITSTAAPRG